MFEKGLPGYDSWLDNHGNPGMTDDGGYDWAIEEAVEVTEIADNTYLVRRVANPDDKVTISFGPRENGKMLFDGETVDLGDEFPQYLGLIDEYHERVVNFGDTVTIVSGDDYDADR